MNGRVDYFTLYAMRLLRSNIRKEANSPCFEPTLYEITYENGSIEYIRMSIMGLKHDGPTRNGRNCRFVSDDGKVYGYYVTEKDQAFYYLPKSGYMVQVHMEEWRSTYDHIVAKTKELFSHV